MPRRQKRPFGCTECQYFDDDPRSLERQLPGIQALSSAFGSTRGRAGICSCTQRFHDPQPACDAFLPRTARPGTLAACYPAVTGLAGERAR